MVRARVEHVFGAQTNDMGGTLVRTIGVIRAKAKIGMKNLAYNMRRLVQLRRLNPLVLIRSYGRQAKGAETRHDRGKMVHHYAAEHPSKPIPAGFKPPDCP
ncbi:hypothetical protein ATER59S_05810 [Aquamicrobium terrae]